MNHLPGPAQQPYAPQAGQHVVDDNARKFLADIESIMATRPTATSVRIEDPNIPSWQDGPRIGTTPPVTDQPGTRRPPMSQRAVDLNTTLISTSVVITALGGATSAVLWASGHANPTVIGWVCACIVAIPAALAIPVLALKSLAKTAKEVAEAAPPTINQHYSGPVHQDHRAVHVHTKTTGVIAYTRNQQPELPPANH